MTGDRQHLLILGCGGFIGSHLLDRLLQEPNLHIEGWDPDPTKISHHLGKKNFDFRNKKCDSNNERDELNKSVLRADVVINLAAICNPSQYTKNPLLTISSNYLDLINVIEACSRHRKWLIHFSTSEVYGRTVASYLPFDRYSNPELYEFDEDTSPLIMGPIKNHRWSYACAKQLLERLILAHHKELGLEYTIIRPFNFFGPKMDFIPGHEGEGVPRVLACFISALLETKPLRLVNSGTARRSILSIHDAVQGIVLILEKRETAINQIFNLGSRENEVSIAELADLMRQVYAKVTGDSSFKYHPIETVSGADFYGEGYEDCDRRLPKLDKAKRLLGWEPKISLEQILIETVTYYHRLYGVSQTGKTMP